MDNISRFQKTTGVGQILDESFARCPEREAIVFGDWRITYRELQALIYRTAHCLRSLGIAPGDRVAIISRNCPEVMIAEIAILKLGGTVVKFNSISTRSGAPSSSRSARTGATPCGSTMPDASRSCP